MLSAQIVKQSLEVQAAAGEDDPVCGNTAIVGADGHIRVLLLGDQATEADGQHVQVPVPVQVITTVVHDHKLV